MSWLQRAWDRIRVATATTIEVDEDDADIHYSPDLDPRPYCGARLGAPWAHNMEAVTCQKCREKGIPLILQYEVNTR